MLNPICRTSKSFLRKQLVSIFSRGIVTDPELLKVIPQQPEKSLFSTLISEALSNEESKKLEQELSIKVNSSEREDKLRPYKKLETFELARNDYKSIFKEFPNGKIY